MTDVKEHAASFCMILAAWAVVILAFIGYLCMGESEMIEIPNAQKRDAAWGCFGSAVLYLLTFFGAMRYKAKLSGQARQVLRAPVMQYEMNQVSSHND
mmetsp:Transcript_96973/g.296400  ORF Transcript_96973/g.296400 Transcript_96973/m.296400 type:complete len:98 (-) Transcript_96973:77-370(-)